MVFAQVDYSDSWEDFFSYNNVKDIIKVSDQLYALSDNGIFQYDLNSQEISKLSSINGLSGETTSSFFYHEPTDRLVIGYQNGLVEVVDANGNITISADIVSFNQAGEKSINHISAFNNTLYLATPFAIVVYDIERLEFGDTYFIGAGSSALRIQQTALFNNELYAATENGVYKADVTATNLIDFNAWQQLFTGNFTHITTFNNRLFTILNTGLFEISTAGLRLQRDYLQNITDVKSAANHLAISMNASYSILDTSLLEVGSGQASSNLNYRLNTSFADANQVFLGTQNLGILSGNGFSPPSFLEIHPEGPFSNAVFSLTAQDEHLWVVYGGYSLTFAPLENTKGISHYNGEQWITIPYSTSTPFPDLVSVTLDPQNPAKAYISAFNDTQNVNTIATAGLITIENDAVSAFYNHLNSGLEDIVPSDPTRASVRVSSSVFDRQGNLWMTNIGTSQELKKQTSSGSFSAYDISSIKELNAFGLTSIAIDNSNTVWIGSRGDGLLVYNESGDRKRALTTTPTRGSLPNANVRTVAVDGNNRVWIGTLSGLVVFYNAASVFDAEVIDASPVIIEEDGIAKKLLGDQTVNTIAIDGANNKWFGTDNGGVTYTNPSGQRTLANFSKQNSPLPSNKILNISVDDTTGKVYFATDKGIVAYNSKVSPFGETLGEVYAYPNPALTQHATVTIDGRNGTHLPKGTNVKILDVSGKLVYETNVIEGQEVQGGKVVWNKKNLAGNPVASGVYIVLLSNEDASQTSVTKIAIVN